MRFRSINIYSGEQHDGNRKKQITGLLRNDSDSVVNVYLKSFKYYNNENCISLNTSYDENILEPFIEDFVKGYPVLHIPFDMTSYSKIPINDKHRFGLKVIYDSINWSICKAELLFERPTIYPNVQEKVRKLLYLN